MKRRILGAIAAAVMSLAMVFVAPTVAPKTAITAYAAETYTVKISEGYLALRSTKAYDRNNEIGKLYSGDTVTLIDSSDSRYWYVYSGKLASYGYVNKDYIVSNAVTGTSMTVKVSDGYLALRTAKAFDYNNEIGKLYTGDTVTVTDTSDSKYWYVYAPSLGKSGYVNKDYLVNGSISGTTMAVRVNDGYLALRNAKAFDYYNEIGKLYTGDTVTVTDSSDSQYWYVYAPSLGKSGYVNKDYLVSTSQPTPVPSGQTKTVRVNSGYLALRNAKAFDYSNEIGKLYTGDTVTVTDSSDGQYWYVYAPSLGKSGYVNKDYLFDNSGVLFTRTVSVASGYLALRNAKAYDASNEIGKLYTGETVQVIDNSGSQYWYVYAPSLGLNGYVNKDYLY